jgi:glutathione S-transferase
MFCMAIEVFWSSGSPFSWRVLLALEAKRLPYTSRLLAMSKREHQAAAYPALNPRGPRPARRETSQGLSALSAPR